MRRLWWSIELIVSLNSVSFSTSTQRRLTMNAEQREHESDDKRQFRYHHFPIQHNARSHIQFNSTRLMADECCCVCSCTRSMSSCNGSELFLESVAHSDIAFDKLSSPGAPLLSVLMAQLSLSYKHLESLMLRDVFSPALQTLRLMRWVGGGTFLKWLQQLHQNVIWFYYP